MAEEIDWDTWPCCDGLVEDETACGDPDHCSPMKVCVCNPECDLDHECVKECHPDE